MRAPRYYRCIVLVLFLAGCGFGKQAQIETFVANEKEQLPKILFADVNVYEMDSSESEIIYVCQPNGLNASKAAAARNQMLSKAGAYIKQNKAALQRIIDNRITMTFVVKEKSGAELFRVSVNPWEY